VAAERGDAASSKAAFEHALAGDPRLAPALAGRATLSFELGDADAALADLSAAIDAAPDDPELRYNRAFVYEHWVVGDRVLDVGRRRHRNCRHSNCQLCRLVDSVSIKRPSKSKITAATSL